ncbi:hypothetical protein BU16DRAFT_562738 [Lophium mytilinum]|uniref:Gfd2/YDR514C-like C-terminal domain-containing protein n=1 Tax=Lophium mytilinum TaxID=390894 RepID=A0A6A6QSB3_9PEZI|nr:hypothetical protein BU16DRAFT_562738 [Lophium mytilinum]
MAPVSFVPLPKGEGQDLLKQILGLQGDATPIDFPDAIFASIDIESASWVPKHHASFGDVTEVGIATLDTRTIRNGAPNLCQWMQKVEATHFRLNDTAGLRTKCRDYHGTPLFAADKFEFGCSTWAHRNELKNQIIDLLRVEDEAKLSSGSESKPEKKYRDVVLVTHAWENEDKYLKQINLSYEEVGTIVSVLDTQVLESSPFWRQPGLLRLMGGLSIQPLHRHNGANDAVYTLAVLLGGAVNRYRSENPDVCKELNCNIEEGLTLLKETIAAEVGGRCQHCDLFGHEKRFCKKWLSTNMRGQAVDGKVVTVGPRPVKNLTTKAAPFKADVKDESEFPGLGPAKHSRSDSDPPGKVSVDLCKAPGGPRAKKGKKFQKLDWIA